MAYCIIMTGVHAVGALGEPIGARLSREDDGVVEEGRALRRLGEL